MPPQTSGARGSGSSGALAMMRQAMEATAQEGATGRLTDEQIRAERITAMRAKDPALGAAIDALDLELLD